MQKVVIVTGASTGIGFDVVRMLVENNFVVVPTVRKQEDQKKLTDLFGAKVKPICIDLTDLNEIEKLPMRLAETYGIKNIFGLVNNAGIALAAPFAYQDFNDIENMLRVNVLSLMKMTQIVLPLMGADSRVINVSSVAGKNASPFLAVYAASKHAVEGFSDALRKELMLLGMKVSIVAPGSIKTPIWQKGFGDVKEKYQHTIFAKAFGRFMKIALFQGENGLEPEAVSHDVLDALTSDSPKIRYAPVPRPFVNWYLPKLIPSSIYDKMVASKLGLKRT